VGVIIFVTGIACIPGVSHMVKEPDWHAYLKVVIDLVAPVIPFGDKE
jgi:hypothetical protein